ncbi:MAG TPA: MBL fold metallo-hydrolase [Ohtaekwangia sp.]|nr:MBL fold metallo-hydrolase [Ohtaekwangia sp.]
MVYVMVAVLAIVLVIQFAGYLLSAPKYQGAVSDHFDGRQFLNYGNAKAKGLSDVIKWMFQRQQGPWKEVTMTNRADKPDSRIDKGIRVTFINHTTFLVQTAGINILTDPVYSKRVSPFTWTGPKRMRPPGIDFSDLPPIDVVVISHNHYDHLDMATVKKLQAAFNPQFIVPLGVGAFLKENSVTKFEELDWWQATPVDSVTFQSVPAQHFSGRGLSDRDATLWCGYVLHSPGGTLYFAGDTGYNEKIFAEIGERCGPVDVAIIPIGAYKPAWFMSPVHCSPEEAIRIHQDVKARKSIAAHYGTFPLADDGQGEPVAALTEARKNAGLTEQDFVALEEGASADF